MFPPQIFSFPAGPEEVGRQGKVTKMTDEGRRVLGLCGGQQLSRWTKDFLCSCEEVNCV